jgi:hypothetical protein
LHYNRQRQNLPVMDRRRAAGQEGSSGMDRRGWVVVLAFGLTGCVGPRETQYLSCVPRPPDVEARSWDWHDPFPDESAGPDTVTRPRSFVEPRSDTRKNFDLRFLQAAHPTAGRTQLAPGPAWPGYGTPLGAMPIVPAPPGPVATYPGVGPE